MTSSASRSSLWSGPDSPLHTDERSLAALRIGLGTLCLVDLAQRAGSIATHYTDEGLLPRRMLASSRARLGAMSIHALGGGVGLQVVLFAVAACLAALLVVGWRTRWVAAGLWLMTMSLHNRNPEILYGGDLVLRLLLFWAIFAPLGAFWSLDAARSGAATAARRVACAGVAALLVQVASMELFAALYKLRSEEWRSGLAVYRAVHTAQITTAAGELLRAHPTLCALLTCLVLVLQLVGPFALLAPFRSGAVRAFAVLALGAMHVGMAVCLDVRFFSAAAVVGLMAFLPPPWWDWITRRAGATAAPAPGATAPRWVGPAATVAIGYVSLLNVLELASPGGAPRTVAWPAVRLGLAQTWAMGSADGYPSGWFVLRGRVHDGREVDLFRDALPVEWERPALPSAQYPDRFWSAYMEGLWAGGPRLRDSLGAYLCRRHNQQRGSGPRLGWVEIVWMQEARLPDGRFGEAERRSLWEQRCD